MSLSKPKCPCLEQQEGKASGVGIFLIHPKLSQVIQIPISASATLGNVLHGQIDINLAFVLALTMVGGTLVGAKLVHHLPVDSLRKLVACLLIVVGVMMLVRFLAEF